MFVLYRWYHVTQDNLLHVTWRKDRHCQVTSIGLQCRKEDYLECSHLNRLRGTVQILMLNFGSQLLYFNLINLFCESNKYTSVSSRSLLYLDKNTIFVLNSVTSFHWMLFGTCLEKWSLYGHMYWHGTRMFWHVLHYGQLVPEQKIYKFIPMKFNQTNNVPKFVKEIMSDSGGEGVLLLHWTKDKKA